ncbi:MAG: protease modulator HflC [Parvibaculaceae bacterium]
MNRTTGLVAAIVTLVVVVLAYSTLFTVRMTEQALVLQFGDPRVAITEPGLNWKIPFIQNVIYFDKRILNLDSPEEEIIAGDQKRLVVDAFARYRIVDPLKFYQSVRDVGLAQARLRPVFVSALRNVLGEESLETLVRDDRAGLMVRIKDDFNTATANLGVDIVDVRIRRADLPEANSQAIYRRMQTEREREAAELRAQGQETAQRIRSRADRDVTVLLAEAQRESDTIRGEGDAKRNAIFAEAYGRDPEFFSFYRSMLAYKAGLNGDTTTMVMSPESDFFRYFGDQTGRGGR